MPLLAGTILEKIKLPDYQSFIADRLLLLSPAERGEFVAGGLGQ